MVIKLDFRIHEFIILSDLIPNHGKHSIKIMLTHHMTTTIPLEDLSIKAVMFSASPLRKIEDSESSNEVAAVGIMLNMSDRTDLSGLHAFSTVSVANRVVEVVGSVAERIDLQLG